MPIIKDIVHQSAFKVVKADLLKTIVEADTTLPLISVFGAGKSADNFLNAGKGEKYKALKAAIVANTTAESVKKILEVSSDFNEFVLLLCLANNLKYKMEITVEDIL